MYFCRNIDIKWVERMRGEGFFKYIYSCRDKYLWNSHVMTCIMGTDGLEIIERRI